VLRRFATCLAFATWCFLNTWVEFAEGESPYYTRYEPIHAVVVPVLCWEILLAGVLLGGWEFCRRRGFTRWRPLHLLFLASCLVPLGIGAVAAMRTAPFNLIPVVRKPWFWPAVLLVAAAPLGSAVLRPYSASRLMRACFLWSWAVLMIVLIQAARMTLLRYPAASYQDRALRTPLKSSPKRIRVVWIIFDELSEAIAFDKRPDSLQLPNLDKLKAESFCASSARAPADSTEVSMPSLILGEQVVTVSPCGPDSLYLRTRSRAEAFAWSAAPNVFDKARESGFNTGLVGWFHPYCRVLNRSLTKCYWTAAWLNSGIEEPSTPQGLSNAMWYRARLQFAALPLVGHLPGVFPGTCQRQEKVLRFSYLLDRTLELITDPSMGLVLVHLPIPHPPAIYNRFERNLTAQGRNGYLDSVALVDETLGVMRQSMEQAGLWERTAVLLSADHGWRTHLWRGDPDWTADDQIAAQVDTSGVPFLLKLPGQTSGALYIKPLRTIITSRLITEILSGGVTDPAAIPNFIERFEAEVQF
jgi:hypothetical protein